MWQYYMVCGLSKLLWVGQEFHKLALLPEDYVVKWCLRWIALVFTCKRSTDGSFHSEKKIQVKLLGVLDHFCGSPKHRQLPTLMWTVSTYHCMSQTLCYFPCQIMFLHWFLCIPSNQLSTVSISRMRHMSILEYTSRAEHGGCCFGINWHCRL